MNNELIFENIEIRIESLTNLTLKNMYHLEQAIEQTFDIIEKQKNQILSKTFQFKDLLKIFRYCLEKEIEEKEFAQNKELIFEQIFTYTVFDLVYY